MLHFIFFYIFTFLHFKLLKIHLKEKLHYWDFLLYWKVSLNKFVFLCCFPSFCFNENTNLFRFETGEKWLVCWNYGCSVQCAWRKRGRFKSQYENYLFTIINDTIYITKDLFAAKKCMSISLQLYLTAICNHIWKLLSLSYSMAADCSLLKLQR